MAAIRFLFIIICFSCLQSCKSIPASLPGKWQIIKIDSGNNSLKNDNSPAPLLQHLEAGNHIEFAETGEVNIHRKATAEDVFYGIGTYKIDKASQKLILSGERFSEKFELARADNDQLLLTNRQNNLKIVLQRLEDE